MVSGSATPDGGGGGGGGEYYGGGGGGGGENWDGDDDVAQTFGSQAVNQTSAKMSICSTIY